MQFNERQARIVEIVKARGPVTGEAIAEQMGLTRASLRPDLAFLSQIGVLEARPRVGYIYKGMQNPFRTSEQIRQLKVKDFYSEPIVTRESTSVYDGIVSMFVNDMGTLFIVNENQELEGIASRKDMLKTAIGKADITTLPIGVIMTRMPNIVVAYEEESLLDVAKRIIEHKIDGMPVVKKQDNGRLRVIGRITKTNITKALVSLGSGEI